jgi:hypothetical protein
MDKRSLRTYPPLEERFWPKVNKNGPAPADKPELGPCWVWTGAKSKAGYGQIRTGGVLEYAHRISYEWAHDLKLPKGERDHHVDHLCRNHACVNPAHLEYVTVSVNVLRGNVPVAVPAYYAKRKKCKHGHEYTEANTFIRRRGNSAQRVCRACARDRYHRAKAA